jgi:enoyl-[acyl-carrier protein] reductase III
LELDLKGRHAVVTGAGRGIGRAIALALADQGVDVAFNYLRNRKAAQDTLAELQRRGVDAYAGRANIADPEALKDFFASVRERFGSIEILIHNAASGVERAALDFSLHHFHWTMDINAWGFLSAVEEAAPLMAPGAAVVAISSLGAVRSLPYYTVVGASKAAIESLARHLATELGPRGIRVNVVSAGAVDTDALKHFPNREELLSSTLAKTPLGRILEPEDVARAVLFLVSDLSAMVTGSTLFVDGGYNIVG